MQAEDRAYQEASIAFYKDKPKAIELFRAIAATDSPHKAAARYNIANLMANSKDVVAARAEANAILADPALASVHGITQELLGYIANLEDTPAGWTALIDDSIKVIETPAKDILASDKLKADYARALNDIDYAGIRGKRDDWWLSGTLPENPTISKAIFDASRQRPMALVDDGGANAAGKLQCGAVVARRRQVATAHHELSRSGAGGDAERRTDAGTATGCTEHVARQAR